MLGSDFKSYLKNKAVLVLLFVVAIDLVVSAFVWRLDFFVHGDLYRYGLVFSFEWADPYWNAGTMLWFFLFGTIALVTVAIIVQYLYIRRVNSMSPLAGVALPVCTLVWQGISLFLFDEKNSMIWNTLGYYGLQFDAGWVATYNSMSTILYVLMGIALVALIIPAAISAHAKSK
jgi:hypothetical protein